jgi:hypothetical protein
VIGVRAEEGETSRQLEELSRSFARVAVDIVRDGVEAAEKAARGTALWKDRSGGTRASIRGSVGNLSGKVTAGRAARYLELGTGPRVIHGRPILRFEIGGVVFYRRSVRHPGTKPRPFMAEAAAIGEMAMRFAAEVRLSEFARSAR